MTVPSAVSRRAFLKLTAGTAAVLATTGVAAHAAAANNLPQRRLRKGIMFGTVGLKGTTLDKFKAVKAACFEGVEPNSHMDQEEVLRARDETGLLIPSVCCATHWDKTLTDPDASVREQGLEGLKQAL